MPALPASAHCGWDRSRPFEIIMARAARRISNGDGEGRNRTGDTTVFSRVLYQLSYLAWDGPKSSLDPRKIIMARSAGFCVVA
jgi:hypothetical protein